MAIASNNNINKVEVTTRFRTDVTNIINGYSKWHSTNWPSSAPSSGGTRQSATPGVLGDNLLPGAVVTTKPLDTDIPYGDVNLGQFVLQLRTAASILSRCRNVRLIKNFKTGSTNNTEYDQTSLAHMTATWEKAVGTFSNLASGDVSPSAVLAFIAALDAEIAAHRSSTVTFTENWCHSNCHSNHSARNRR